jgi:hypothetical protein
MALYYELPIYKDTYQLVMQVFRLTRNFSREYKYTIGQDIKKDSMEMVRHIFKANSTKDKGPHLQNMYDTLEVVDSPPVAMPVNHVCAVLCKLQYRNIVYVLRTNSGYFVPSNNYWSSTDNSTNPTTNVAIWNFNGSGNTNNNNKTNSNSNIYTRCVRT